MDRWKKKILAVMLLVVFLFHCGIGPAMAQNPLKEVTGEGMALDLAVLRPLGLVATVGGCVTFILSLPFTAWTEKRFDLARHHLVGLPVTYTFIRPLGELGENPESY